MIEDKIINIGLYVEKLVGWMTANLAFLFDFIKDSGNSTIGGIETFLLALPFYMIIALFVIIAWFNANKGVSIFTLIGFLVIYFMGFWTDTMETLALVLVSTVVALVLAIPLGILVAKSKTSEKIIRPILDLMQTMPAFVYLIPAVLFFSIGKLPGAFATIIFAMPPAVRFTALGIQQVPAELIESARAFGCTPKQMLLKVELPIAKNTIFAGLNQTIMMALSMVVVAGMIAAGGLGERVLEGINNLDIALGFESGLAVVILAIILDRITQGFGKKNAKKTKKQKDFQFIALGLWCLASLLFVVHQKMSENELEKKTISIAYVDGWDEGKAMTMIAKNILESKGYEVKIEKAAVDLILASMANGTTDLFLDTWLPATHGTKIAKFQDKLVQLGKMYDEAKIGLCVPSYVPINSIEELNVNKDKFKDRIVGIEEGAGISEKTKMAIYTYELDLNVMSSSTVAMLSELQREYEAQNWIVFMGWEPHWMFGRWDLKILDDPRGIFGDTEQIYAYSRIKFDEEHHEVAQLIANMHFDADVMARLLADLQESDDYNEAIRTWVAQNSQLIASWN
ncbi:MAG: ABC transporter permease/substrate binding protein [Mangrovibacterium sp.]